MSRSAANAVVIMKMAAKPFDSQARPSRMIMDWILPLEKNCNEQLARSWSHAL